MEKIIAVAIMFLFLLSPIFAMSGDGGNVPVEPKKESVKESDQIKSNDKSDPSNFKFETDNITFSKNSEGDAVDSNNRVLVPARRIILNEKGEEVVLDNHLRNTGLSIKDFVKHQSEYLNRVLGIERKKGVKIFSRFTSDWYDNRVNLDKLDDLQASGFDIFNDKKEGIGNNFEEVGITAEAVVIGEIIESEDIDIFKTGYHKKLKIKIDEIIKNTSNFIIGDFIECGQSSSNKKYQYKQIPFNKKGVIVIGKTGEDNKNKYNPLEFLVLWEINDNKITGFPRRGGEKETLSLDSFKNRVHALDNINDSDNFYKRSWKEIQK
ncbi:MAG TPA: hypothetical protein PLP37_09525 [Clostridiales bacterium]|nr:hypothetical protein [Clostridiales bacterium]